MKTLKIDGKEYKLEYSFEAAYDGKCVENVARIISISGEDNDIDILSFMPKAVVSIFYYGLLEHNPVESETDAKKLVGKYFAENKEENIISLAGMLTDCMSDDGFLKLLGIVDEEPQKEAIPTPQDHQKKQTKAKASEK